MPFLRHALAALLLAASFAVAPATQAATISVQIDTNVTGNSLFITGPLASFFTAGEAIEITLTFDDAVADGTPAAGTGTFLGAISQLDVLFPESGLSFQFGNPFSSIGTSDDIPQGNDSIAFSSASRLGGEADVDGNIPTSISVALLQEGAPGPPGTLVVDDRPATPFEFTSATFTLITDDSEFTQMLLDGGASTSVPEPATALLITASLLPIALRARRR